MTTHPHTTTQPSTTTTPAPTTTAATENPPHYDNAKGCLSIIALTAALTVITVVLALIFGDFR